MVDDLVRGPARAPVMADVARVAGVSQKTVSRVVNDAPYVRDSVRRRVNAAIAELGYRPNAAARALASQRSNVIGIVTPGVALYGPSAQLFGLERAAREAGYAVVIVSTADGSAKETRAAVSRLLDLGVDGIALAGPLTDEGLSADAFDGVPSVSVGDPVPGLAGYPAITCDQRSGARQVTEHLLILGHRTVWHVAGPESWYSARSRRDGWAQALRGAGADIPEPFAGDWSARSGYEAGLVLADRPDVTAVFAANDQMAAGVMCAMKEKGREIPADVSVAGFDDAPDSEFQMVPLTTVRQDFSVISRRAMAELVGAIAGKEIAPGIVRIPVDLVVRASSGPAL